MCEAYVRQLKPSLHAFVTAPPALPLYSCTTTRPYPGDLHEARELALAHWMRPVEFRQTIENMYADGFRVFMECGPRGNLSAFVDNILAGRPYVAIPANVSRRSGIAQINHLLALAAAHGLRPALEPLYRRRRLNRIDFAGAGAGATSRRLLGPVKIPTGAPDMRLSPDVAKTIRRRIVEGGATVRTAGPTADGAAATAPVPAMTGGLARGPQARSDASPRLGAGLSMMPEFVSAGRWTDAAGAASAGAPAHAHAQASHVDLHAGAAFATREPAVAASVMSAYLGTMDHFLGFQQDLVSLALGTGASAAGAGGASHPERPPFIHTILTRGPEGLVARCTIDMENAPFLRDHCLGRDVSADDPDLTGLPIVPFTLMMEIMAEAASVLEPGLILTEMRRVRVHRWVAVDAGPVNLEVHARRLDAGRSAVRVIEPTGTPPLVAEGEMVFERAYPPAPVTAAGPLPSMQPYKTPPDRLYEEAMFHGPAFRGVASVEGVTPVAARATLVVPNRAGVLPEDGASGLVTDFVLLDQPGQLVGFWASQFPAGGALVLPVSMALLRLYGPPPPAGTRLACVAAIEEVATQQLRSSLDVAGADGRLWARIEGWEDRRFDVPAPLLRTILAPGELPLARAWGETLALSGFQLRAWRLGLDDFPDGWFSAHGGLWTRVLAATVLGRRERECWRALELPERRRIEWLLGRIAAKDAVREHLREHHGWTPTRADVELLPDEHGRPTVHGGWVTRLGRAPLISISHSQGVAAGIAASADTLAGLGIDIEPVGRMTKGAAALSFSEQERQLLDAFERAPQEDWLLRLWCAKEACAKATGRGLAAGLHSFRVTGISPADGSVAVRYSPSNATSVQLLAHVRQEHDQVLAVCCAEGA
jgi:phosphopantetheine--protein transferase-like protein